MKMNIMDRVIVCNSTFNNILVLEASFIGGGNRSTRRKPPNCVKKKKDLQLPVQ
jgi:hypothetical protein